MLKVNEHPWKFPDGRMACGLTPLGKGKFSFVLSAEFPDWVAVLAVGLDEVDAGGMFSLPWMNEVSAEDMLLNWCKVGLSQ